MSTSLTITSATTFSFTINFNGGGSETFTDTFEGGSGTSIATLRFFNFNPNQPGGNNDGTAYFNSPTVVPEPSSFALGAGPALLGAWILFRRRRT